MYNSLLFQQSEEEDQEEEEHQEEEHQEEEENQEEEHQEEDEEIEIKQEQEEEQEDLQEREQEYVQEEELKQEEVEEEELEEEREEVESEIEEVLEENEEEEEMSDDPSDLTWSCSLSQVGENAICYTTMFLFEFVLERDHQTEKNNKTTQNGGRTPKACKFDWCYNNPQVCIFCLSRFSVVQYGLLAHLLLLR